MHSLNEPLNSTYKKATGSLYHLSRLRTKLNIKASLEIYMSHILPLFTYCSITTHNSTNTYKEKLRRVELQAQKIISINSDLNLPPIEKALPRTFKSTKSLE